MHGYCAIIYPKGVDIMATTNITIRMDSELKKQAEAVLNELGMNFTTAYTVFTKQLVRDQCFPFVPDASTPNKETLEAIREVEEIEAGRKTAKSYTSVEELFNDINSDV